MVVQEKILEKRSKLTKKYYNEPTDHSKNFMVNMANKCTRLITAAKEKNLIQMSAKLEDPNAALKTYCFILNKFLSKKNKIGFEI